MQRLGLLTCRALEHAAIFYHDFRGLALQLAYYGNVVVL